MHLASIVLAPPDFEAGSHGSSLRGARSLLHGLLTLKLGRVTFGSVAFLASSLGCRPPPPKPGACRHRA
eukprot:12498764-Alexandrium_andersonii.AAC.1